jgi:dUTP pyrophosphatase
LSAEARDEVEVRFQRLPQAEDLPLPRRATPHAAGFDLHARVDGAVDIEPGERHLVPTGFAMAMPAGFEAQIRPRSGLAIKYGLTLLNSPGTIDSDYRGEVGVVLVNLGRETVTIARGDRIAQLVVHRLPEVGIAEVDELPDSERGAGGFGHTGKR